MDDTEPAETVDAEAIAAVWEILNERRRKRFNFFTEQLVIEQLREDGLLNQVRELRDLQEELRHQLRAMRATLN
jgi:hypothetical protein